MFLIWHHQTAFNEFVNVGFLRQGILLLNVTTKLRTNVDEGGRG